MKKHSAALLALAFVVGFGLFNTSARAQDDSNQTTDAPAPAAGEDAKEQETFLEKLEDDLKETTTPTDEETDAIGTGEDADRDLY